MFRSVEVCAGYTRVLVHIHGRRMEDYGRLMKRIISALGAILLSLSLASCAEGTTSGGSASGSGNKVTAKPAKPEKKYTVAQEQAIQAAQGYIDMGGFSRKGLIQQLTSKAGEGFRKADAVFAVNHIKVDWNEQAVISAKGYLDMGGFSRASLIQQLTSPAGEQFTRAQAVYAANKVGLK